MTPASLRVAMRQGRTSAVGVSGVAEKLTGGPPYTRGEAARAQSLPAATKTDNKEQAEIPRGVGETEMPARVVEKYPYLLFWTVFLCSENVSGFYLHCVGSKTGNTL